MLATALAIMAVSAPLHGQALLDDLAKRAVNYFWDQSNPVTGITKDRASNFTSPDTHTVGSVAATGYALAAYAVGVERGWLNRDKAVTRTKVTLNFLENKALKSHGWFTHFVDWSTGERVWNSEYSTIDTALLVSGMIVDEEELNDPEITRDVDLIISQIDWKWALTNGGAMPNALTIDMGYSADGKFIDSRWDALSEEMMLYIQALGAAKDMPIDSWIAFNRTPISYDGRVEVIGGTLFMHEMSQGFLPFEGKRDRLGFDYSVEEKEAILNDRQFCIDDPHHFQGYSDSIWGLSASDYPGGYTGHGGPGWGADDGTVTPTCAICAVQVLPKIGMQAADAYMDLFPKAYGIYGFSNAINPGKNWIDPDVIGIDLGMMLMGIENARDGLPSRLSWKNPMIRHGFERAGFHSDTDEGPFDQRALQKG